MPICRFNLRKITLQFVRPAVLKVRNRQRGIDLPKPCLDFSPDGEVLYERFLPADAREVTSRLFAAMRPQHHCCAIKATIQANDRPWLAIDRMDVAAPEVCGRAV